MQHQRRDFLKAALVGATGFALIKPSRALAAWPASGTLAINPKISNMRVVACNDTAMMKSTPTNMTFAGQNAVVDTARVQANMDAMAMQLANGATADEAWKTIFRSSKDWGSTVVAIKVNTIEPKNMARLAVVEKFCRVLAGFGVPAANIFIYDGNSTYGAGISNYASYFSPTDSSKIPGVVCNYNDQLGGTTSAPLPDGSSATCTADVAKGKVDILINIANNKGHSLFGGSTLCMKNHFGTFAPNHTNLASYVLAINKSDAIVGGDPPRQQLCFIDSLVANKASNTGTPEVMPCYLIMGVFAPAVDYLTVKKVREEVMNCKHDANTVNSFLTSFGYTSSDPVWVLVPPAGALADAGAGGVGGTDGGAPDARGGGGNGNGGAGGAVDAGRGERSAGNGGASDAAGPARDGAQAGAPGSAGTGGQASGNAGSGGRAATSSPATGGVAGQAVSSDGMGGKSGTGPSSTAHSPGSGSGCHIHTGKLSNRPGHLGTLAIVGAVVAGKLWRLCWRRDEDSGPASGAQDCADNSRE